MSGSDRLLMRTPQYQPLESPLHYILRLSEANGYWSPTIIIELAMRNDDWRVTARWDYGQLNTVLPPSRQLPCGVGYCPPASTRKCELALLGKPILSRHLYAPHAGVCPDCVHALAYAPAWWDLKYAVACPVHHRALVRACPACGRLLSHLRRGLLTCACGASLDAARGDPPDTSLLWLMALLRRKTEDLPEAAEPPSTKRSTCPDDFSFDMLCRVIDIIMRAERQITGSDRSAWSLAAVRSALPQVASFLHAWPSGVDAFCARWYNYIRSLKGAGTGFRASFNWAFQSLFKNLRSSRSQALFIIDEVLRYESDLFGGSPVDVRAGDLKAALSNESRYRSLATASEASGLPYYTLLRRVRAGRVPHRTRARGSRPVYEVEMGAVHAITPGVRCLLWYRAAAKYLGVTHALYLDLRRNGVIPKKHATVSPTGIAQCDLDAFKQRIVSQARRHDSADDLRSLDALRRSRFPRDAMVRLVKGMVDGSVACFGTGDPAQPISALLVRASDVQRTRAAAGPAAAPTIAAFRTRYELSNAEAHALVSFLGGREVSKGKTMAKLIDRECIDAFMTSHVGLKEYSRRENVKCNAALRQWRRSNQEILEIAVPHGRGRFVYFIPRTHYGASRTRS